MSTFEIEILLPGQLTPNETSNLQKCEGKIITLSVLRHRASLSEIATSSYYVNGAPPDVLSLLEAYRVRFPAVITQVLPGKMLAVAVGVGFNAPGLFIQNTSPVDLCNGDYICLLPPIFGPVDCIKLDSVGLELVFPLTIPQQLSRDLIGKIVARSIERCAANANLIPNGQARHADIICYNGRRHDLQLNICNANAVNMSIRTLMLNMMFSINEGCLLLLALIPTLLISGTRDSYTNLLLQTANAMRETGQLVNLPHVPHPQDGHRRFVVYESISSWISTASKLGDALGTKAILRICTFDGPSTVRPGERISVIQL
ncbi:unknown [Cercopithecine alphaherpesvirus 9]|uniref:Uncharacterized protein n=1 Tax=Cercopithecine herpesvirus 9 (strain DHV) TaxID=36348 RepID=Q9E1X8_CHV9D|nr:capsid triplex subunit 2 [Cercopithecine alphaherpesvirus 9]AAG27216.1 unknown [Cercopithecine alphaherpesvirus 9]